MPSSSTISSSEKGAIKKHAQTSTDKILAGGICRIYYSHPDPSSWSWTGLEGALTFGNTSKGRGGFWFKLVDIIGTRGVIWQYELYDDLIYHQDRTFFHTFAADECMIGFVFADEGEATSFYKKVINRAKHAPKKTEASMKSSPSTSTFSATTSSLLSPIRKRKTQVVKDDISKPAEFKHVAHMGFDSEKGFTMNNIDPSWAKLLQTLGSMGISEDQIQGNEDFIKDFVASRGGPEALIASQEAEQQAQTQVNAAPVRAPPPVMRPPTTARKAPPLPPSRNAETVPEPVSIPPPLPPPVAPRQAQAGPPPPPPPPVAARTNGARAPPRKFLTMDSSSLRPIRDEIAAPPSRPANTAPPPPPPPAMPPAQDGRANLLASIQGQGIHSLKKTSQSERSEAPASPVTTQSTHAAGGPADLASTLAAALNQRKGNMGDDSASDREDDEDW